jgi:apolipoprotein N-acyltransferase
MPMEPTDQNYPPWYRSTFVAALAGSVLLWAALPPLAIGWLAWIAPVPWLLLICAGQMPGRRPYRAVWLAGFVFWLMTLQWLRLPHPATSLGWIALSAYLAFYLPMFVGLTRVGVHRAGMPLWLAAPVVWTGLELVRAHLLTGFLTASLAHTQVNWTTLIQISDLVGEYGVSFLVMLVAASVVDGFQISAFGSGIGPNNPQRSNVTPQPVVLWRRFLPPRPLALLPAVLALAGVLVYGHQRMFKEASLDASSRESGPRIALVQGNSLAEWKSDPSRERQIMDEYLALSERAIDLAKDPGGRPVDVVVWPETMFRSSMVTFEPGYQLPPEVSRTTGEIEALGRQDLASLVRRLGTPVLVGVERAHFGGTGSSSAAPMPARRYNSAVLAGRDGTIAGSYDKVHRVLFGEYIPFANWVPGLYQLTPLTGGIEAGDTAAGLELDGVIYAPNICYETTLPHVIRYQVATLRAQGKGPDVLVNLTNDAWYWGSSALDLHLASGVFRAVETRRPLVIAANGGISAWIDHAGRIRAQSPRQRTDVILADIESSAMRSWYVELGDWFSGLCLGCCIAFAVVGWCSAHRGNKVANAGNANA